MENAPGDEISCNGECTASPNQYPWMVRLQMNCGGALISDRHVLTSFHCLQGGVEQGLSNDGAGDWVKVAVHNQSDESDYRKVRVKEAVYPIGHGDLHSRFDRGSHDIAIIILAEHLIFDSKIQPICLPNTVNSSGQGSQIRTAGWGLTYGGSLKQSDKLKHLQLNMARVEGNYLYTDVNVIDGVPQDPCDGDSGGPLMDWSPDTKRWTVIGTLVGKGFNCITGKTKGDGQWNTVSKHMPWINEILTGGIEIE